MAALSIDHLVLTVSDMDATVRFYVETLGMAPVRFGDGRTALSLGAQKINLHRTDHGIFPRARVPSPGSADICLLSDTPIEKHAARFAELGVRVIEGPVERSGATGPIRSIYVRDPDGNLIEVSNRIEHAEPRDG